MAQKWDSNAANVFGNFDNDSRATTQIQSVSTANTLNSSSVMMPSSNSFGGPSNNDKEVCLRSQDCSASLRTSSCSLTTPNLNSTSQLPMDNQRSKPEHAAVAHCVASCFVCNEPLEEKNFYSIKSSMNHSRAPLLVLLVDVLGYKLDEESLHTNVMCKSCYHLLDAIDELQQSLTESKTNLRTKFLDTIQRLKLKYPRTDKMLKPRCLRCVQMTQSASRRRMKGGQLLRGKGGEESTGRPRGAPASRKTALASEESPVQVEESAPSNNLKNGFDSENTENLSSENSGRCYRGSEGPETYDSRTDVVFDTDPMFFSPDEKLKVGISRANQDHPIFLCMYCEARYDNSLSLKMHVRVYHMPVIVYDNGQGTTETRYRMGIKLQNTTLNEFNSSEKPYACLFCVCAYKLQSSLQFHFRENHSPNKPFQCLECKESFRRTIELSRHRLYRCPMRKLHGSQSKT